MLGKFVAAALCAVTAARRAHEPAALLDASEALPPRRALAPALAAVLGARGGHAAGGGGRRPFAFAAPAAAAKRGAPEALRALNPPGVAETDVAADPQLVLKLPERYADTFSDFQRKPSDKSPSASEFVVVVARLADEGVDVDITARPTGQPGTIRDMALSQMMSVTGVVPSFFDHLSYDGVTYKMTEAMGTRTLGDLIGEWESDRQPEGKPIANRTALLPVMVDLIWSVVAFGRFGVVHGDLKESSIFVVDGHPVIQDFRNACLDSTRDSSLSYTSFGEELVGSAYRHAPEMVAGLPNNEANNVWQLGLIFAKMITGGDIPTKAFVEEQGPEGGLDDATPEGREAIRELIREKFDIMEVQGIKALDKYYADLVAVVAAMLEKDPSARPSALEAASMLDDVKAKFKVELPPPRFVQETPASLESKRLRP